jgi:hypothetical protein
MQSQVCLEGCGIQVRKRGIASPQVSAHPRPSSCRDSALLVLYFLSRIDILNIPRPVSLALTLDSPHNVV